MVFRAVPAFIGVSVTHKFEVNSLAVPRKPGEAVGGICKLKHANGKGVCVREKEQCSFFESN